MNGLPNLGALENMVATQIIYYSVGFSGTGKYEGQWIQSIRSLRRHNADIPVYLFVFNKIPECVASEAKRWRVQLVSLGDYPTWLATRHRYGALLAHYPTLHKLLVLSQAQISDASQVLYLDCDTFFFADPQNLFATCSSLDWYAREVPGSARCPGGPTDNMSDQLMRTNACKEGLQFIPGYNTGVCLMNHGLWSIFCEEPAKYLNYAWRLLVGMCNLNLASSGAQRICDIIAQTVTPRDLRDAIPYPSNNWWILDEIACAMCLGRAGLLNHETFTIESVAHGLEFVELLKMGKHPVLVHYFSMFEAEFFKHCRRLD